MQSSWHLSKVLMPSNLFVFSLILIFTGARIILHTRYINRNQINPRSDECRWTMLKEVIGNTVKTSHGFLETGSIDLEEVSPIMLHSTYKATSIYIRLNRENLSNESNPGFRNLKSALRLKNRKWKAAGLIFYFFKIK